MIISILLITLFLLTCYFFQNSCRFCKRVADFCITNIVDSLLDSKSQNESVVVEEKKIEEKQVSKKPATKTKKKSKKATKKTNKKRK